MTEEMAKYEVKVGQHGKGCECSKCQHRDCHNCKRPVSGDACTMSKTDINTCLSSPDRPFHRYSFDGYQASDTIKKAGVPGDPTPEQVREWAEKQKINETDAFIDECREEGGLQHDPWAEADRCQACKFALQDGSEYPCVECEDGSEYVGADDIKYDPKSRYYDAGGLEVLDIIKAKLTPEQYQGFCLGNAIKYTCRANHKGDYDRDLEKACFYAKEAR